MFILLLSPLNKHLSILQLIDLGFLVVDVPVYTYKSLFEPSDLEVEAARWVYKFLFLDLSDPIPSTR